MARDLVDEILRGYMFHVTAVPLGFSLFGDSSPVLTPDVGFASVTIPEMSINVDTINEGNMMVSHRIPTSIAEGEITMTRGATYSNNDFYVWIMKVMQAQVNFRRDLVIVQYFPAMKGKFGSFGSSALVSSNLSTYTNTATGAVVGTPGTNSGVDLDTSNIPGIAGRIPARAWKVTNAFPTRYKPGGDMDANSSELQISELAFAFQNIQEFSGDSAASVA
jgi:phage tail-like protein